MSDTHTTNQPAARVPLGSIEELSGSLLLPAEDDSAPDLIAELDGGWELTEVAAEPDELDALDAQPLVDPTVKTAMPDFAVWEENEGPTGRFDSDPTSEVTVKRSVVLPVPSVPPALLLASTLPPPPSYDAERVVGLSSRPPPPLPPPPSRSERAPARRSPPPARRDSDPVLGLPELGFRVASAPPSVLDPRERRVGRLPPPPRLPSLGAPAPKLPSLGAPAPKLASLGVPASKLPPPPRPPSSAPPPVRAALDTIPPTRRDRTSDTAPRRRTTTPPAARSSELPAFELQEESSSRASVVPVARSVRPSRAKPWWSVALMPAAVGMLVGFAVFFVALFVGRVSSRSAAAVPSDGVIITVSGPGGVEVDDPQVHVDGARRCEASPCRVTGLDDGMHFVAVSAAGYATAAPRVVRLDDDEQSVIHVELVPSAPPREPHGATAPPSASPTTAPSPAPVPSVSAPVATGALLSGRDSDGADSPTRPAVGWGSLNLNSVPATSVVLDGRPIGRTPKLGVRVAAGAHQVVFVHPEEGRRLRAISVEAGAQRTVAVRF